MNVLNGLKPFGELDTELGRKLIDGAVFPMAVILEIIFNTQSDQCHFVGWNYFGANNCSPRAIFSGMGVWIGIVFSVFTLVRI